MMAEQHSTLSVPSRVGVQERQGATAPAEEGEAAVTT